ncbi:MAG: hypothetical protein ACEY3D_04460 [Rickettsia sp.]
MDTVVKPRYDTEHVFRFTQEDIVAWTGKCSLFIPA